MTEDNGIVRCDNCGKEVKYIRPSQISLKHHFCNRACFNEWESDLKRGDAETFVLSALNKEGILLH